MQQMQEKGVKIIVEDFPEKIQLKQKDYQVFFKNKTRRYEKVMGALGRVPNISKLKIENAKIKLNLKVPFILMIYLKHPLKIFMLLGMS